MTKQWLTHFSDTTLALSGFFLFFLIFMMVLVWIFRKNSKELYNQISTIPLNDERQTGEIL